MFLEEWFVLF